MKRSRLAALVVVVCTAAAVAWAFRLSLDPRQYFSYGPEHAALWTWDPTDVLMVCSLMTLAGALLAWSVAASKPKLLWLRTLIAGAVVVPWAWYSSLAVIHMPAYILLHHAWIILVSVVLALLTIVSLALAAIARIRRTHAAIV